MMPKYICDHCGTNKIHSEECPMSKPPVFSEYAVLSESKPCCLELRQLRDENAKLRKSLEKAEKLAEAVRCALEDRVHNTTGIYSPKNNKCRHGNCGYEGCAWCIEEYLEKAYATYRAKEPSHD